jgi:hypothetical protein
MTLLKALIEMITTTWPDGEINIKERDEPRELRSVERKAERVRLYP